MCECVCVCECNVYNLIIRILVAFVECADAARVSQRAKIAPTQTQMEQTKTAQQTDTNRNEEKPLELPELRSRGAAQLSLTRRVGQSPRRVFCCCRFGASSLFGACGKYDLYI